ncbi:MAG TPA: dephospho-CoA kinase [Gemmataceae bacterium]|nr:dephospho-CoA kinase [Gemmataceae bacterium]
MAAHDDIDSNAHLVTLPACHLVIGLVGGIGAGKSRVAEAFARRGARVITGDALAHEALRQPEVKEQIVRRWGAGMLDDKGEVHRRQVAGVVFGDPGELKALEAMVHPWIKKRIRDEVDAARTDGSARLVVLDAAVMLEAGWHDVCDKLVFIDAPRDARRRRVAQQRGWKAEELEMREAAQLPLTAKAAHADHTIDNSASLDHLERQVDELVRRWGRADESAPAAQG